MGETEALVQSICEIAARPLEKARAMPPRAYTDEGLFAREMDRIFSGGWLCAGRAEALSEAGSYLTYRIGEQPVVAVRQKDGTVRAFANVCLHRMMVLLSGTGRCKRIVCPYHAWTYDIDGRLIGAPHMDKSVDFDPRDHALPELRCEIWLGWIFISLDPDAVPIAEGLADLETVVARYGMEDYVQVVTRDHVWDTNWKLLTENFMESYHLPTAHRATVGASFPIEETEFPDTVHKTFTYETFKKPDGAVYGLAHPDNRRLDGIWRRTSIMPTIFPSHMFVLAPDHLWYLSLMPKGTGQVHVRFGAAIAPEVLSGLDDPEAYLRQTVDFFDQVNNEDRYVVESIHKGARAPLSTGGQLSWLEREIHDFVGYLAGKLAE